MHLQARAAPWDPHHFKDDAFSKRAYTEAKTDTSCISRHRILKSLLLPGQESAVNVTGVDEAMGGLISDYNTHA